MLDILKTKYKIIKSGVKAYGESIEYNEVKFTKANGEKYTNYYTPSKDLKTIDLAKKLAKNGVSEDLIKKVLSTISYCEEEAATIAADNEALSNLGPEL